MWIDDMGTVLKGRRGRYNCIQNMTLKGPQKIGRQTDRQTDRQAGRQAGRQADRQTDRMDGCMI